MALNPIYPTPTQLLEQQIAALQGSATSLTIVPGTPASATGTPGMGSVTITGPSIGAVVTDLDGASSQPGTVGPLSLTTQNWLRVQTMNDDLRGNRWIGAARWTGSVAWRSARHPWR